MEKLQSLERSFYTPKAGVFYTLNIENVHPRGVDGEPIISRKPYRRFPHLNMPYVVCVEETVLFPTKRESGLVFHGKSPYKIILYTSKNRQSSPM